MNKDNTKRKLNEIWKEVQSIDREVYGGNKNHTDALVRLYCKLKKMVTIMNEVVDEL